MDVSDFRVAVVVRLCDHVGARLPDFGNRGSRPDSYLAALAEAYKAGRYSSLPRVAFANAVWTALGPKGVGISTVQMAELVEQAADSVPRSPLAAALTAFLDDPDVKPSVRAMENVVNYVDLYRCWVDALRPALGRRPPLPAGLVSAVSHWLATHVPASCAPAFGVDPVRRVCDALGDSVSNYHYDHDFVAVWLANELARTCSRIVLDGCRPEPGADFEEQLKAQVAGDLDRLEADYGVYSLSADDLVAHAMAAVLLAAEDQYAVHAAGGAGALLGWARAEWTGVAGLALVAHSLPLMAMRDRWTLPALSPRVRSGELQKRRALVAKAMLMFP